MEKKFYVYIVASQKRGFIYIGMTSDLARRIWEHREGIYDGHTKKYSIKRLVYYEVYDTFEPAQVREKKLKRWRRTWKDELIEAQNPEWNELYTQLAQ